MASVNAVATGAMVMLLLVSACSSPVARSADADAGDASVLSSLPRCASGERQQVPAGGGHVQCECYDDPRGVTTLVFHCGAPESPGTVLLESECYAPDGGPPGDAEAYDGLKLRCSNAGAVCGRVYCGSPPGGGI